MKTVVLAAGEGKRLRPLTSNRPKVMLPVANQPILEHILLNAKHAGLKEFVIVVSYKKDSIVDYFGDGKKFGFDIEYVDQLEPLGTAHAISAIEEFVDDYFVVLSGDTLLSSKEIRKLSKLKSIALGVKKYTNTEEYGTVEIRKEKITKIVEKTKASTSPYINLGVYVFNHTIFDSIESIEQSKRGEFEITDAIQHLIEKRKKVTALFLDEWMDASRPWNLFSLNEFLLRDLKTDIRGEIEKRVTLKGTIRIGKGTRILAGTYIEGPVIIGEDCRIGPNCYLRPFTSIGNNCHVGNACEVKNSIIMNHTNIPHHNYVGDTIIGEHCNLGAGTRIANLRFDKKHIYSTIDGQKINTGKVKFGAIIGDYVQIGINASINVGTIIGNRCYIGPGALVNGEIASSSKIM